MCVSVILRMFLISFFQYCVMQITMEMLRFTEICVREQTSPFAVLLRLGSVT